jgi:RHS repeat-associated protein
VAVRTNGTLSYLLGDHIGSSSVTTDANGVKTASALYKAFGETRFSSGNLGTDYKFTGQREEASLGIYYFNARWMDPSLGRFTSPDTIVPTSTQGTQAWDRYGFVNNNPVRYTDPTGHQRIADTDESQNNNQCDNSVADCDHSKCWDRQASNFGAEGSCTYAEPSRDKPTDEIILRGPDYITLNIATGWPFAAAGFDFQVTRDSYNNWYVAPGAYVGTPGVSLFGGWVLQPEQPKESDLESFVGENTVSLGVGGGDGVGFGAAWGRPFDGKLDLNDFAGETGFSTPGIALSWVYGFKIPGN